MFERSYTDAIDPPDVRLGTHDILVSENLSVLQRKTAQSYLTSTVDCLINCTWVGRFPLVLLVVGLYDRKAAKECNDDCNVS